MTIYNFRELIEIWPLSTWFPLIQNFKIHIASLNCGHVKRIYERIELALSDHVPSQSYQDDETQIFKTPFLGGSKILLN